MLYCHFSCSGFHGHSLPVHFLQGLWDHVSCVDSASLHAQQQTAGEVGEHSFSGVLLIVCQEVEHSPVWKPVLQRKPQKSHMNQHDLNLSLREKKSPKSSITSISINKCVQNGSFDFAFSLKVYKSLNKHCCFCSCWGNATSGTTLWPLCSRSPELTPSPPGPFALTFSMYLSSYECTTPALKTHATGGSNKSSFSPHSLSRMWSWHHTVSN